LYNYIKALIRKVFGIDDDIYQGSKLKDVTVVATRKNYDKLAKEKREKYDKLAEERYGKKDANNISDVERRMVNDWDGGKLIPERLLKKRIKNIVKQYKNFKLEVHFVDEVTNPTKLADWNRRKVLGSFKPGVPPKLYFRKNVTELTWQHEIWHLEDLKKWGSKKFKETPLWKHEESVWEKVWANKNKWTENELADSYHYYKEVADKAVAKWNINKEMEALLEKPYYKYKRYNN
jgi:hypothetical protein